MMGFMMPDDLTSLIRESFNELMNDVHVCLPAEIIKYDADTMTCSAQPLIQRRFYRRANPEKYPVINRIPVVFSRTANAMIRLPVKNGDIVTLVFADHELSNWVNSKGASNVYLENRKHHINDCFAFVGGYPIGKPHTAKNPDALEIIVAEETKITIGNESEELLQIAYNAFTELKALTEKLSDTLTNIQALTVTSSVGGGVTSTPINAGDFATTKTAVDSITTAVQSELDDLAKIKV